EWAKRALQTAARVQDLALLELVTVDLVEQGAQAYAQLLRRRPPVPTRSLERGEDLLTLGGFDRAPERPAPRFLLLRGAGSGERFLPEIRRLQHLPVRQHRRPLDGMLQLAHVARPLLLLQPGQCVVAQNHGAPKAAREAGRKVARQRFDVGTPAGQG